MNRPVGMDSQKAYLHDEIRAINRCNDKHSDFVRYYRSGMTHWDSLYLRNRTAAALYLESFHYERARDTPPKTRALIKAAFDNSPNYSYIIRNRVCSSAEKR